MLRRLLISILLTTSISASADEVEDQINLGLESYKNKEYKAAVDDLNYAVAQIQEKMNLKNATLLPEPLDGWTATAVENNSAGMAMMVGGTQMSRSYQHDSESLEILITSGSPMVAGVLMMINNPMVAGASGGKLQTVNGQRAIVQYAEATGSGEVNIVVDNRFMVTVRGQKIEREELLAYAEAMDYEALAGK